MHKTKPPVVGISILICLFFSFPLFASDIPFSQLPYPSDILDNNQLSTSMQVPLLPDTVDPVGDPLLGNYTIAQNAEFVVVSSFPYNGGLGGSASCHHYLYDITDPLTGGLELMDEIEFGHSEGLYGKGYTDVAVADFNNDGYDDYVAAWEGPNQSIILHAQSVVDNTITGQVSHTTTSSPDLLNHYVSVLAVDFDTIPGKELVLTYADFSNQVHIEVYTINSSTMEPELVTSIANTTTESLDAGGTGPSFDITAGDFNSDGLDELLLMTTEIPVDTVLTKIRYYSFDNDTETLISGNEKNITSHIYLPEWTYNGVDHVAKKLCVVTGDYNNDGKDDIAYSSNFAGTWADSTLEFIGWPPVPVFVRYDSMYVSSYTYAAMTDLVNDTLLNLSYAGASYFITETNSAVDISQTGMMSSLQSVDLNNDGKDEHLSSTGGTIIGVSFKDTSVLVLESAFFDTLPYAFTYFPFNSTCHFVGIDADASIDNPDLNPEIVMFDGIQGSLALINPIFDADTVSDLLGNVQRTSIPPYNCKVIGAGDFDNDAVKVGPPNRYQKSDIVHPLMILNAPPMHFDIIGDDTLDINAYYEGINLPFVRNLFAEYSVSSSSETQVKSEMHMDWGVSSEISAGGSFLGASVSAGMKSSYGENFSKVRKSGHKVEEASSETTRMNDRIYGVWADYDLWEYPVYHEGVFQGYMLVTDPAVTSERWRSVELLPTGVYSPQHECGNLLSYPTVAQLESSGRIANLIKENPSGHEVTYSSDFDWSLTTTDFTSQEELRSMKNSFEASASAGFAGTKVGITGTFSSEQLSSFSSTVSDATAINLKMLNSSSYTFAEYTVYPYFYWATNGALVLDYAVELTEPPGTSNIWEYYYNPDSVPRPDLAFIKPLRYHPEKDLDLFPDTSMRHFSPSITVLPRDPDPGDMAIINVSIHNFSLTDLTEDVSLKLYYSDPSVCADPLPVIDSTFTVTTGIPSREVKYLSIDWQVPASIPKEVRIYGEIDPNNDIAEIHQNNNIGFGILFTPNGSSLTDFGCDGTGFSCCLDIRGNADNDIDDILDISDLLYLIDYMFLDPPGPSPACFEEADVNADAILDISDLLYLVDFMFLFPPGPEPLGCE